MLPWKIRNAIIVVSMLVWMSNFFIHFLVVGYHNTSLNAVCMAIVGAMFWPGVSEGPPEPTAQVRQELRVAAPSPLPIKVACLHNNAQPTYVQFEFMEPPTMVSRVCEDCLAVLPAQAEPRRRLALALRDRLG